MAAKILLAIALCQFGLSAATQFGYAPGEPIVSIDDMVQHAYGKISKLANNFKRMAGNAKQDANNLLQSMKIQSSDPEGLIALITETKMAIAFKTPAAGVNGTACTNKNDPKYQTILQEAGPGIQVCLQNASADLQPYYQTLDNLVALAQERLGVADGNVTDCVNTNHNNSDGMASCLNTVGVQVFDGRDKLMAAILSVMADYKRQIPSRVGNFTGCTNNVQDKAISECVDIIDTTWQCYQA
ncbi:uncharacterized protein [Periplaneta americana]|uniref:uncharacterized protein n=1 Tax=Periplaneta americana TaxID=6978 RepID=UPI0037E9B47A